MKAIHAAALIILLIVSGCSTNQPPPSYDSGDVYDAFLRDWNGREKDTINLSSLAHAPSDQEISDYQDCLTRNKKNTVAWSRPAATELDSVITSTSYVHIVDSKRWGLKDPKHAVDQGGSIDSAVEAGFKNGLMQISAVSFDPTRNLAAITFSFRCGQSCGNGGSILYKKTVTGWVRSEDFCGEWMS